MQAGSLNRLRDNGVPNPGLLVEFSRARKRTITVQGLMTACFVGLVKFD